MPEVALSGDVIGAGRIGSVGRAIIWRRVGTNGDGELTIVGQFFGFGTFVDVRGDTLHMGEPCGSGSDLTRGVQVVLQP